jgi:hypothetical protein
MASQDLVGSEPLVVVLVDLDNKRSVMLFWLSFEKNTRKTKDPISLENKLDHRQWSC